MNINLKFPKIFYGWWIVIAIFIIAIYISSIITYGFTAIFEPVISEQGWTYTQVSFAASLRGVEEGFLILVIGVFIDRWGPRIFVFGGAILTALGLFMLSNISSLPGFYVAYIIVGFGRSFVSNTVMITAVANWFHKRTGVASAFALSGSTAGGLLAPAIVKIIDNYGWRVASTVFGAALLVIVVPLSLLIRHKPEPYGYSPDDIEKRIPLKPVIEELKPAEVNVTLKQAISSRAFWQITLAYIFQFIVILGLLANVLPYLSSIGIARSISGILMILVSVFCIVSRIIFGFTVDKFSKRIMAVVAFIMMFFAMLCMAYASTSGIGLVIIGLILYGASWGCNAVLRVTQVREIFGRKKFGSILGLMTGIAVIVGMAGPPLAGWVFDNWQSYQNAWLIFAGLSFLSAISILTIPKQIKYSS
jgi:sugar phosphate permease